MGSRSANEISADLTAAGLPSATAERFAAGRGYKGQKARNFIAQQHLDEIEISPAQQKALFLITYKELEGTATIGSRNTAYLWIDSNAARPVWTGSRRKGRSAQRVNARIPTRKPRAR